jgi:hypothetical protein
MPFWSKQKQPRPEWAKDLSEADERSLTAAVEELLRSHRIEFEWIDEGLRLEVPADHHTITALERLANTYKRAGSLERVALIERHFRQVLSPAQLPERWGAARAGMRAGVRPRASLRGDPWPEVTRELTDELIAVLILDAGGDGHWVSPERLATWGVTADEAWKIALENVRTEPLLADRRTPLAGGGEVRALFGTTGYGAARAVELDRFFERPAPMGALLSVPAGNLVIFHVIGSPAAFSQARQQMLRTSASLFNSEEWDPVSPHLHWWRAGRWQPITFGDEKGTLRYRIPDELAALEEAGGDPQPLRV